MLIYQNFAAATDTELRSYILFNGEEPSQLDAIALITNEQRNRLRSGEKLNDADIDRALTMNKDLRGLHDRNRRPGRGSFDQVYAPLGGWKFYFERNGMIP